jgi:hypothetical protein
MSHPIPMAAGEQAVALCTQAVARVTGGGGVPEKARDRPEAAALLIPLLRDNRSRTRPREET